MTVELYAVVTEDDIVIRRGLTLVQAEALIVTQYDKGLEAFIEDDDDVTEWPDLQ